MLKEEFPNTLNLRNYINNHSTTIYVKRKKTKHFEKKNTQLCHIYILWYDF